MASNERLWRSRIGGGPEHAQKLASVCRNKTRAAPARVRKFATGRRSQSACLRLRSRDNGVGTLVAQLEMVALIAGTGHTSAKVLRAAGCFRSPLFGTCQGATCESAA